MTPKRSERKKSPKPGQVFGKGGVVYSFRGGDQGQMQVRVDFSQVRPPSNYYYADALHLRLDQESRMSVLSFGLRNEKSDKFSDRIDVVMPTKALMGPFWDTTRPVEATLDQILEGSGLAGEPRAISRPDTIAPTLFANMIFLAVGDGESTLDFYHLSPREVYLAKTQRKDIELAPTVRVIMSSVLTKQFFNTLRPHAESSSASSPALDRRIGAARTR